MLERIQDFQNVNAFPRKMLLLSTVRSNPKPMKWIISEQISWWEDGGAFQQEREQESDYRSRSSNFGFEETERPVETVPEEDRRCFREGEQHFSCFSPMQIIFQDRELARKLLKEGKKDRAKLLLRKKKYQEGLLDQTAGQLDNIERLCQDLEFTQVLTLWNPHLHPFIVRFKSKCWMDCKKGMMLWRKQTLFSALMKLSLL